MESLNALSFRNYVPCALYRKPWGRGWAPQGKPRVQEVQRHKRRRRRLRRRSLHLWRWWPLLTLRRRLRRRSKTGNLKRRSRCAKRLGSVALPTVTQGQARDMCEMVWQLGSVQIQKTT